MAWERVADTWYDEAIDRPADNRSVKDRAMALMQEWLKYSILRTKIHLKVEYGYAMDPKTEKPMHMVIAVTFNDGKPVQFSLAELRWAIDKMRGFFEAHAGDDPEIFDTEYKRQLDGFFMTLEKGIEEAEALDPKHKH